MDHTRPRLNGLESHTHMDVHPGSLTNRLLHSKQRAHGAQHTAPRLKWDARRSGVSTQRIRLTLIALVATQSRIHGFTNPLALPPPCPHPLTPEPFAVSTQTAGDLLASGQGALGDQSECHWRRTLPQNPHWSSQPQQALKGANTSCTRHRPQTP